MSQPAITRTVNGMPISEAISSVVLCACSQIPDIEISSVRYFGKAYRNVPSPVPSQG
jgi:hypothetical protein